MSEPLDAVPDPEVDTATENLAALLVAGLGAAIVIAFLELLTGRSPAAIPPAPAAPPPEETPKPEGGAPNAAPSVN